MGELSRVFNIRVKQGDLKSRLGQRPTYKLEWIMLNRYWRCPCILGIYGDQYVVAATSVSQQRSPFVPFSQYRMIQQNPKWKNLRYRAGYRHFQAQFDIGYSFFTGLKHLPCVVSYGVDVGVHGDVKAWAQISVDGILFPAPFRIPLRSDLSDLPGKVVQINEDCHHYIERLGASYLRDIDPDSVYRLIRRYTHKTAVPFCVREDLRTDPKLDRCITRLDVLLLIMKAMNLRLDDNGISRFISLTQKFVPQK
jgi:hypothetical protein